MFFDLSGYLVGKSALRNFAEGWRWRPYLLNRFTRLWVVLIPALLLGGMWDKIGSHFLGGSFLYLGRGQSVIFGRPLDSLGWRIALGNICFLQTIRVSTFGSNGALWSLANEFWYYMLFPLLLLIGSRRTHLLVRILYGLLALGIVWLIGFDIARQFLIWLMGAALYYAPQWKTASRLRVNLASVFAAILVLIVAVTDHREVDSPLPLDFVLGGCCALLLWILLQSRGYFSEGLVNRCSHRLAAMSYSLYLLHLPFVLFLAALVHPEHRWQPDLHHAFLSLAIVFTVLAYAFAVYCLFERNTSLIRNCLSTFPALRERSDPSTSSL